MGLPVRTPASLKNADEAADFAALELDAAVVAAYGLILPKAMLDAPRLGCLNIHASLLPRWRGAAPIQRAIMAGDAKTGVTTMLMEEGLDTGPMLMAEEFAIGDDMMAGQLHDALSEIGADLIGRALDRCRKSSRSRSPRTAPPTRRRSPRTRPPRLARAGRRDRTVTSAAWRRRPAPAPRSKASA